MKQETEMLDKIANAYYKAESKEMKAMWKEKWYQGVKNVARRYEQMYPKFEEDRLN
tara:strand:+ start:46 stop:213 length:168 start_codon:yes stop_codon:yes gene_type:complete